MLGSRESRSLLPLPPSALLGLQCACVLRRAHQSQRWESCIETFPVFVFDTIYFERASVKCIVLCAWDSLLWIKNECQENACATSFSVDQQP